MLLEEANRRKLLLRAPETGADRRPRSVNTGPVCVPRNQGAAATPPAAARRGAGSHTRRAGGQGSPSPAGSGIDKEIKAEVLEIEMSWGTPGQR